MAEFCTQHDNICDRLRNMEEKLSEVHNDIKDIKNALIGDLNNVGWLTKLTNEDKDLGNRIVEIEKKVNKYEVIFEKFVWKLIGALTTSAVAGGGIVTLIQHLLK